MRDRRIAKKHFAPDHRCQAPKPPLTPIAAKLPLAAGPVKRRPACFLPAGKPNRGGFFAIEEPRPRFHASVFADDGAFPDAGIGKEKLHRVFYVLLPDPGARIRSRPNQKLNFSPSWMIRMSRALVTWPNVLEAEVLNEVFTPRKFV